MAKDKRLALAFDFGDAPQEVKDAAAAHRESFMRLEKAEAQVGLWNADLEKARQEYSKTNRQFEKTLDQWLGETKKVREEL